MIDQARACRSCGADILWAITDSGRPMPVDATPHPEGRLGLFMLHGRLQVRVLSNAASGPRHRPHFATCPDADSWRRR